MSSALIITPDPNTPGLVSLTELTNLYHVGLAPGGVLEVGLEQGADLVYYAPGAWHSFTKGDGASV